MMVPLLLLLQLGASSAPTVTDICRQRNWTASVLSPPTGRNTPGQCPGCKGQVVTCIDCASLVPMFKEAGETPELTTWEVAVAPMVAWSKSLTAGTRRTLYGPSFGLAGEGSNGRPEWAGIVNPNTGVSGPSGRDILGNATCGNFSGPWWDGQIEDLTRRWSAFLSAFKAAGGLLDEVSLDTEISSSCEMLTEILPYITVNNTRVRLEDCGSQRWRAIGRDPRFGALRTELEAAGFVLDDTHGPDALWVSVRDCAHQKTGPGSENCQAWDAVMHSWAARYFNASLVQSALAVFPNLTIGDYSFAACRLGSGIPSTYGSCGCGGCGRNRTGAVVGNLQLPVLYQDFHLYSNTYKDGPPRIGLPSALAAAYGVPEYNRTSFNVFKYDTFIGREKALAGVPFKPWVAVAKMGVELAKQDPYPSAYGFTNGSAYYVETMFHLALMGAQGFYFWNPIQFQLSGDDNQLFSDLLHELDDMLGPYCEARQWVRDWSADTRQPWMDSFVLTGTALMHRSGGDGSGEGTRARRVWRLTISMTEHTQPPPDPRRYVISMHPLTLRMPPSRNAAAGGGGTVTTITFGDGASIFSSRRAQGGADRDNRGGGRESILLSRVGLWIVEPATAVGKALPNRTLCDVHNGSCRERPWPSSVVHNLAVP